MASDFLAGFVEEDLSGYGFNTEFSTLFRVIAYINENHIRPALVFGFKLFPEWGPSFILQGTQDLAPRSIMVTVSGRGRRLSVSAIRTFGQKTNNRAKKTEKRDIG